MFGLGVGPTKVELTWEGDRLSFAWMDQRPPEFRAPVSPRPDIIRVDRTSMPAAVDAHRACRSKRSRAATRSCSSRCARARPSTPRKPTSPAMRKLKSAFPGGHVGALFFTTEPVDADVTVYSRMFAPSAGVIEDPATGSAAGPLGCYMVKHGLVRRDQMQDMVNLQGVAMGRPSRLHMRISRTATARSRACRSAGRPCASARDPSNPDP